MSEHLSQDRLLELAYGELSPEETAASEAHVHSCDACARPLSEIREVRRVMGGLSEAAPPKTGQESLLQYAAQAAQRRQNAKKPSRWGRYAAALGGLVALSLVAVLAVRVQPQLDHDVMRPSVVTEREAARTGTEGPSAFKSGVDGDSASVGIAPKQAVPQDSVESGSEALREPTPAASKLMRMREQAPAAPATGSSGAFERESVGGSLGAAKKAADKAKAADRMDEAQRDDSDLNNALAGKGGANGIVVIRPTARAAANTGAPGDAEGLDGMAKAPPPSEQSDWASAPRAKNRVAAQEERKPDAYADSVGSLGHGLAAKTAPVQSLSKDKQASVAQAMSPVAASDLRDPRGVPRDGRLGMMEKAIRNERAEQPRAAAAPAGPPVLAPMSTPAPARALARRSEASSRVGRLQDELSTTVGNAREPLLSELCREETRVEQRNVTAPAEAESACAQLLREFPRSTFAPEARRQLGALRERRARQAIPVK